jgi:hypothetical protein
LVLCVRYALDVLDASPAPSWSTVGAPPELLELPEDVEGCPIMLGSFSYEGGEAGDDVWRKEEAHRNNVS